MQMLRLCSFHFYSGAIGAEAIGAEAIGEIISCNSYGSAKFPITYPRLENAYINYEVNPIDHDYRNEFYPFGFGLQNSYRTFQ